MGTADEVIAIHQKAMERQQKALIEKACEWMELRLVATMGSEDAHEFLTKFIKAMKE